MPSSTSSFKLVEIGGALASALLLLVAYTLLVPRILPTGGDGTSEWQKNLIRAERYALSSHAWPVMIAGSSMGVHFQDRYFSRPDEVFNLSLSGGSALTGLAIAAKRSPAPRVVLIEANETFVRLPDVRILESLYSPVKQGLGNYWPGLREEYIPSVLVHKLVRDRFTGSAGAAGLTAPPPNYEALLAIQQERYDAGLTASEQEALAKGLDLAEDSVETLVRKGARVVFFEPPIAPSLARTRMAHELRATLQRRFPPNRYRWVPAPDPSAYQTADGLHLLEGSARRFVTEVLEPELR